MKIKKTIVPLLIAGLLLILNAPLLLTPRSQQLQASPKLQRLLFEGETPYLYLGSTAALNVSENRIIISTFDDKITVLERDTLNIVSQFSAVATPHKLFYASETVLSLQGTSIVLNKSTSTHQLNGTYDSFMVDSDNGRLYALTNNQLNILNLIPLLGASGQNIDESAHLLVALDLGTYLGSSLSSYGKISAFTADADHVFVALPNPSNKNFDDIFSIDINSGLVTKMYERTSRVASILRISDRLYTLSRGELTSYSIFDGMLSSLDSLYLGATDFCIYNSTLFALNEDNGLVSMDKDFNDIGTIFLSQSSDDGFFSAPTSVFTRRDRLFIADTLNNRLVVKGSLNKSFDSLERIRSVVSDSLGNIYVAHSINKITKLDKELNQLDAFSLPRAIKRLIIGINDIVLIISGGNLFSLAENGSITPLSHIQAINSAAFKQGSNTLYFYDGVSVFRNSSPLNPSSPSYSLFSKDGIISFDVDLEGNAFLLTEGGRLFRFDSLSGTLSEMQYDADGLDLSRSVDLTISRIKTEQLDYGDLIFTDSTRHCFYKLSGDSVNVKAIGSDFTQPSIDTEVPVPTDSPIIFRLKANADLFPIPIETENARRLSVNDRIIYCSDYNELEEFAFVIYEDSENRQLDSGYVFRSLVDFTAYSFSKPLNLSAVVFFNYTPIYKLPSIHSAKLDYYDKGTELELMEFSAPKPEVREYSQGTYVDSYGKTWYRVRTSDSIIGFIQSDNLSLNHYVPQERPRPNATIKAYGDVSYAIIYSFNAETNSYEAVSDELPIPSGTRVEITKTPLDSQSEFTEIKFYREGLGTLTCFVKTVHVKYDTVNTLQIVAIAALMIVLMSVVLLFVFFIRHKKYKAVS